MYASVMALVHACAHCVFSRLCIPDGSDRSVDSCQQDRFKFSLTELQQFSSICCRYNSPDKNLTWNDTTTSLGAAILLFCTSAYFLMFLDSWISTRLKKIIVHWKDIVSQNICDQQITLKDKKIYIKRHLYVLRGTQKNNLSSILAMSKETNIHSRNIITLKREI